MDKFLKEYHGAVLDDDIMYNSEDVKSFSRKFKNFLKRSLPDCEIAGYSLGHYYVSAFLEKDGKYVYLNYNIPRYRAVIDIHSGEHGFDYRGHAVLIRTASGPKDYHGGTNNFCSLATIPDAVNTLFERGWMP